MYKLGSLNLTNYLIWDEVTFEFERGVTHLSGGNRCGKSLLLSPLRPILYNSVDIPRNARAHLQLADARHGYDFTIYNSGKSTNRFEVTIDGKHQKGERIADSRNLIEKYFCSNIQESIFETTVSLSGLTKHPLTTGKPSTRLDWVYETLAYASVLDSLAEEVEKKQKEARTGSIKYDMTKDQLAKLEKPEKPDVSADDLRAELEGIDKSIKKQERIRRDVEYAIKNKAEQVEKPEVSYEEAKAAYEKYEQRLNELTKQKNLYEANKDRSKTARKLAEKLEEAKTNYKVQLKKLKLPSINPKKMVKIATELHAKYQKELGDAEDQNHNYAEETDLRKFRKKYKDYELSIDNIDTLRGNIASIAEQSNIVKLQISAHKSGRKHCSVCGSNLTTHQRSLKQLRKTQEGFEEMLERWELEIKIIEAREAKLTKKVDTTELEEALVDSKELALAAEKYLDIKERLDDMGDVNIIEYDVSELEAVEAKYKKAQKQFVAAKVYRSTQKQLEKIQKNEYFEHTVKELKKLLSKTEDSLTDLYRKQKQLSEKIIHAETNVALYKKYKREKADLDETLDKHRRDQRDYKILSVMRKALGREGFRTKRLEKTLELFVDNLNELAPLLWKEPFKFEINIGPRKCDLIIHRNNRAGSAFNLSGSEQRCWSLLSGLSMLRLLPANRRCDTIVLDELEANMDTRSRAMMMQDFIPELQKTVPNIIVISPLTLRELTLKPDRAFYVEKKNNRSKLLAA